MRYRLRDVRPWDPRHALGRVSLALTAGGLTYMLLPDRLSTAVRAVGAWNAGGAVLLALAWFIITTKPPEETQRVAAAQDPGLTTVWVLVLTSSAVSFFAAAVLLRQVKGTELADRDALVALGATTVLLSWLITHTAYTLRYAHLYYRDDTEGIGGLEFPGCQPPDYLDFAYFAFTVGMCFQVSDVTVSSRQIRHSVLGHALLAFAYNTVILALALNLALGAFS